jgi:gliding motility-associated-like protein
MKQTLLFRNFLASFFLLVCSGVFAQLTDFTLNVTAVNESCTANGVLNFTASNTTAGATILYRIYHLPDMATPIVVTSLNTFTGLTAGTYRVVATQSLGNESGVQQQDVVIVSTIVQLIYNVSGLHERCGNDGKITVNVTNSAAVSYELFAGPVIRPLQASNVFENLPAGIYSVRAFDSCGEGVATTVTIYHQIAGAYVYYSTTSYANKESCNTIEVENHVTHGPTTSVFFPITVQSTVFPPSGVPMVFTQTFPVGTEPSYAPFSFEIPLLASGSYTYNVLITDACGNTFATNNITVVVLPMSLQIEMSPVGCSGQRIGLRVKNHVNPVMVNFTSAPAGFNPILYNPNHPGPFFVTDYPIYYFNNAVPFPPGDYSVSVTDVCGTTVSEVFAIGPPPVSNLPLQSNVVQMCNSNLFSLMVGFQSDVVSSAQLTAAPAAFGQPLPMNLAAFLIAGNVYMAGLPVGQYVFDLVNPCGFHKIATINIQSPTLGPLSVEIVENCNSFNLRINQYPYNPGSYWLQKLNNNGQWGHPDTGLSQPSGISETNARQINYNSWNYNLQYSGSFRIMRRATPYGNASATSPSCEFFVYAFEYSTGPKILDVYSFVCENGTYDAIVSATGYATLHYKITAKNGQPFIVNNNLSNIFLGLEPAIYNFQIEDGCGNILNSLFDISQPGIFEITSGDFCQANAWLSVPEFPFLSYEWRKDDSLVVLSTTHELLFPTFNPATDNGIYHMRVFYAGNPNSCIDYTIDYIVNFSPNTPNAGNDNSTSYCGSPGMLDLSTLLTGNFDFGGNWQEITSSGVLTDNIWNAINVDAGNYQFRYTVNGLCNASDESIVNIQINPIPETPAAFLEQAICDGGNLYLLATNVPGNYEWSGPNGFVSNLQNPVIENVSALQNGTYTVKAIAGGCESGVSSVNVAVSPLPLFTLAGDCIDNQYTITASVTDQTIDPATLVFSWNGPDNYSDSGNPVTITGGKRGIYTATATTPDGCAATSQITVATTMCSIPTGVSPNDDTRNDTFDLAGFDVLKFKVYNRYGRMVYEQDNYTNQWHGQDFNGNILPDATYYYYIRLFTGEERTGWVYVTK